MNVTAVLDVAKRFDGEIIAGESGLSREIYSIEVMEVPEVTDWATAGVLVITTFYPVKDDLDKQNQIVEVLINKEAAGIVVKLGRFIESLPKGMIQLAEAHDFPIIIVPKNVTYFDFLTPLHEQLNEKNMKSSNEKHELYGFINQSFSTVEEAITHLSEVMNCHVYIEDMEGRLLYCTKSFTEDGWRDSQLLFSIPYDINYQKKLKEWNENLYTDLHKYINIPGKRNKCIIPLKNGEKVFATIHLSYKSKEHGNSLTTHYIKLIQNKIYEIMMSEVIEQQQLYMKHVEQLSFSRSENNLANILLYFKRDLNKVLLEPPQSSSLNYHGLFRKEIKKIIKAILNNDNAIIINNQARTYVLLSFLESKEIKKAQLENSITEYIAQSTISDTSVSISSVFNDVSQLKEKMNAVAKIMQIGEEFHPLKKVYSYDKLGIYEFLIKLSTEPIVQQYVDEIISPIYHHSDKSLLETLIVYLQENGNSTKAAEKLFIHRRTMTNRLLRIKTDLSMELNDPENIFILQFCLKIKGFDL